MLDGYINFIVKNYLALAITAIIFGWLGWWLRCKLGKCTSSRPEVQTAPDKTAKLEAELRSARTAASNAEAELQRVKTNTADRNELAALRKELDASKTEADSLRIQAQKARESADSATSKVNEAIKKQQERVFTAENELSKAREEIARLRSTTAKPANASVTELQAELQQARRSLATATNSFGTAQRERDAARAEAERLQERLSKAGAAPRKTKVDPFEEIARLPLSEEPKVEVPLPKIIRAAAPLGLASIAPTPAAEAATPEADQSSSTKEADVPPAAIGPQSETARAAEEARAKMIANAKAAEETRAAKAKQVAEAKAADATNAAAEAAAKAEQDAKAAADANAAAEAIAAAEAAAKAEQEAADAKPAEAASAVAESTSPSAAQGLSSGPTPSAVGDSDILPGLSLEGSGRTTPLESGARIPEATAIMGKRIAQDDLKIVEGIGPKIEGLFNAEGIATWRQLSETSTDRMSEILKTAGDRYALANPGTWAQQAGLAADGRWVELKELQDNLDGGKAPA